MKYLLYSLTICAMFVFASCETEEVSAPSDDVATLAEFSAENVAFFDARVRSIDTESYVQELYFVNLSGEELNIANTFYQGLQYSDMGEGNDLVANDGVFTSVETFAYNDRIQYDERNMIRSVLENPVVSPSFSQNEKLSELAIDYEYRNQSQSRIFEVTCDITWTGGGCNACDWWGGAHCDWCFSLDNCSVTVGF